MGKIVFNTNILIEISRKNTEIFKIVSEINPNDIYISAVVYAEFMRGIKNKDLLKPYLHFLDGFKMLYSSTETDKLVIEIFKQFSLSHKPEIADIHIVAICLNYDATLYTLNTKDFSFVPDIKLL